MRRENSYEAFTLVEMLIVMGIIIVLMGVGITAGRFAINRANDVAHQNAVDNIYQGLQAYYTDNREYPTDGDCVAAQCAVDELISTDTLLGQYMDDGAFDGGTEATYYYFEEGDTGTGQTVLVCVSKGGIDDSKERGVYCNGNGFGSADLEVVGGTPVTDKDIEFSDTGVYPLIDAATAQAADWDGSTF